MPHADRWAGASVAGPPRDPVRRHRRAWRRRSRKAQVSAVATILGLLLVVTFIANYLATTLPNTMAQNDLQHETQMENQVAQFSAILQSIAQSGQTGAQASQPISFGSAGAPPFAGPDASYLSASNVTTGITINFTVVGPVIYTPPTAGTPGGTPIGSCTYASSPSSSITCSTGTYNLYYNFTGSAVGTKPYTISLAGTSYTAHLNLSVNASSITLTAGGTMSLLVFDVFGSNDTISVALSAAPETILLFGSNDTLTLTGAGAGGRTTVFAVGNYDTVSASAATEAGNTHTFVMSFYGIHDGFTPGTISGTGNSFTVYFTGFNPANPTSSCPVDNLAGADTVGQPGSASGNTYSLSYNNTTGSSGSGTNGKWTVHNNVPALFNCPYNGPLVIPIRSSGPPPGAGFVVHLQNTYVPSVDIAYDQGAVLIAQPGGTPLFYLPPPISFSHGTLTVVLMRFATPLSSEGGTGSSDLIGQLLSVSRFSLPGSTFSLQNRSQVTITIVTPFAAAWYAYFLAYSALSSYVTCTGAANVCSASTAYQGPTNLGTVTLAVPATGLTLRVLSALYSITLA